MCSANGNKTLDWLYETKACYEFFFDVIPYEPVSYKVALQSYEWKFAIEQEHQALIQ